ncbi:unnamed protein product, partial [Polarella glacialis]
YLAIGADTVEVYNFATKSSLAETASLKDHSAAVMGVCLGFAPGDLFVVVVAVVVVICYL